MNHHKPIIDPWVDLARHEWLERKGGANLRQSAQKIVDKIKKMSNNPSQAEKIWHHIDELIQLQERIHNDSATHNKETPQIYLDCGIAAYHMGNARQALNYVNAAIAKYSDQHDRAVAYWLLGCLCWCLDDSVGAIANWENSLNQFEEQSAKIQRDVELQGWYVSQIAIMKMAIEKSFKDDDDGDDSDNSPPRLDEVLAKVAKKEKDREEERAKKGEKVLVAYPPPAKSQKNTPIVEKHSLRSIPVLGEIPAGAPLGVLPGTSDYLTTQTFKFTDDSEYRVVSLIPDRAIVRIQQQQEYFILRVSGNSMNQCKSVPILDGDYVLLLKQDQPRDNDIVAAEIITADAKDDRATLKRYKTRGDKILLIPESSDPKFQQSVYVDKIYSKVDEEFHIRGVALSVFKKL